ncbi:hypothetical protein, partial [Spirosoma migulaei]
MYSEALTIAALDGILVDLEFASKTIISGSINPVDSVGKDGDYYIKSGTSIFGPKVGGVWPAGVSIIGANGNKGWSPVYAIVNTSTNSYFQVADWTGGEGTKPDVGQYLGSSGLVADTTNATNFRGAPGANGAGVNIRGAWAANTDYAINDVVENGGTSYYRKTVGNSGISFDGIGTNWGLFALGGGTADNTVTEPKIDATLLPQVKNKTLMDIQAEVMPNLALPIGVDKTWSTSIVQTTSVGNYAVNKIAVSPGEVITIEGVSSNAFSGRYYKADGTWASRDILTNEKTVFDTGFALRVNTDPLIAGVALYMSATI